MLDALLSLPDSPLVGFVVAVVVIVVAFIVNVLLWKQIGKNASENNVDIKYFVLNPSEHIFFLLLEAEDYLNIEKTIGQCKKTGDLTITPVIDVIHTPLNPFS